MYFLLFIFFLISIYVLNPAFSIFLGTIFAILYKPNDDLIFFKLKTLPLQIGIVLMGFNISISYLIDTNINYLPWISLFVVISFLTTIIIATFFGINKRFKYMLASGFAVCGASAMIAIAPLVKAKPLELLSCLMIFFVLNMIAILAYPLFGQYLGATNEQFGLFSALAIQDTSSVIGTSIIFSQDSAIIATSLKLMRTLWLIPLVLLINSIFRTERGGIFGSFPPFILFFILAVIVGSFFNLNKTYSDFITYASLLFINIGLFSIGLTLKLNNHAFQSGLLYTSFLSWLLILISSLLLVSFGLVTL